MFGLRVQILETVRQGFAHERVHFDKRLDAITNALNQLGVKIMTSMSEFNAKVDAITAKMLQLGADVTAARDEAKVVADLVRSLKDKIDNPDLADASAKLDALSGSMGAVDASIQEASQTLSDAASAVSASGGEAAPPAP
jgi:outer membrane murein-binding lipoprotein Lpp